MNVVYAPVALNELDEVWDWNARRYDASHATGYLRFLREGIANLSHEHGNGKVVEANPALRHITLRRRLKADGHVVVYRVESQAVRVLHVFHTKQDWQKGL